MWTSCCCPTRPARRPGRAETADHPAAGSDEGRPDIVWPTGRRIDTRHATVELQGDIQSWPFDSYVTTVVAQACTDADGQSELPTEFAIDGDVQGWHLAITPASEQAGLFTRRPHAPDCRHRLRTAVAGRVDHPGGGGTLRGGQHFSRSPEGRTGISGLDRGHAFRDHSHPHLPARFPATGSPPPGSWVDIAVVLWVIVALGTALVFGVGTWWRFGRLAQSGATEDVTPDAVGDSSESRGLIR